MKRTAQRTVKMTVAQAQARLADLDHFIAQLETSDIRNSLWAVGHILGYNEERDRIIAVFPELL